VIEGYVSRKAAADVYGVVINDMMEIDHDATQALRASMSAR